MSGGYFDYRNQDLGESMHGRWCDREINDLFDDLFFNGTYSPRDYGGLALSLDFYLDGDIAEEDYRDDVRRFKNKWFGRTPKQRIKFYQDELKKEYEALAKELEQYE